MLVPAAGSLLKFSREEIISALKKAGCPPFEPFVQALTNFGGLEYENPQVGFPPGRGQDGRPKFDGWLFNNFLTNDEWRLFIDHQTSGPFPTAMAPDGKIYFDWRVPIYKNILCLLENDALECFIRKQAYTRSGFLCVHRGSADQLDAEFHSQRISEAGDEWNLWWWGEGFFIRWHMEWVCWSPQMSRSELVSLYADSPSRLKSLAKKVHSLVRFSGPTI